MSAELIYGVLIGAGSLALAQNLGDYRIDQEFLEYVFNPAKVFILHLFGKSGELAKIEKKAQAEMKSVVSDLHAKLVNVSGKVEGEAKTLLQDLVGEVKKVL